MVKVYTVPAFADNYIWLVAGTPANRVAIVDPGEGEAVIAALQQWQLVPAAILITHHHRDHTGGIARLQQQQPATDPLPVFYPAAESIAGGNVALTDGDRVAIAGSDLCFQAIATPGHTHGHLCYYGHGLLFSGDTLFSAGCGRLFEGSPAQMYQSLQRLAALPAETKVYAAHEYTLDNLRFAAIAEPGNQAITAWQQQAAAQRARAEPTLPTTLSQELAANPFMRVDEPPLVAALTRYAGQPLPSGSERFAVLRAWKDHVDQS